jgi:hypothetical protein
MDALDPRHGSTAGFHAGCRLLCCRRAYARYEKRGKVRRSRGETWAIPALGAQRRIQALLTLGWTTTDIAHAAGWQHRNSVQRVLSGQDRRPCRWIERKTHETLCEVYERLSMQIPPHAPHRARTRALALRRGYAAPLMWDDIDNDPAPQYGGPSVDIDPVVVMRLLEGKRIKANRAEREEAIRQWVADGGTKTELCNIHDWAPGRYQVGLRLVEGGAA